MRVRVDDHASSSVNEIRSFASVPSLCESASNAAAASQAVDRLVRSGMVSRTPDPADRRAVRLSFTAKAAAFMREHERRADALLAGLAARFSAADFATFRRVLADVLADLEERWLAILAEKDAAAARTTP